MSFSHNKHKHHITTMSSYDHHFNSKGDVPISAGYIPFKHEKPTPSSSLIFSTIILPTTTPIIHPSIHFSSSISSPSPSSSILLPVSSPSSTVDIPTSFPESSSSSPATTKVVGGIIGGVLLIIFSFLFYALYKRQKKKRRRALDPSRYGKDGGWNVTCSWSTLSSSTGSTVIETPPPTYYYSTSSISKHKRWTQDSSISKQASIVKQYSPQLAYSPSDHSILHMEGGGVSPSHTLVDGWQQKDDMTDDQQQQRRSIQPYQAQLDFSSPFSDALVTPGPYESGMLLHTEEFNHHHHHPSSNS
ncbi:uncharacterized protein BX664DRAFT_329687 [Halteromyces radiatus]|uniref:uncharacterized protein n=1 Tax=Halteromyces radiatus TaxID=101107 RepID=UPI00221F67E1|nr:uncharacterized protein BX664DRAFT_329687 [Halteromyces radiatus]KAI8093430.1 hypothetical protein BX664DRAFT_329687 [Halteromyces radiatus]